MQAINFVIRSSVGGFQSGVVSGQAGNSTVFLQENEQISLHLARHQISGYERADGEVISSLRPQIIQNLEGGILAELRVAEGDVVNTGDVLARLHDTKFQSSVDELHDQIVALEIRRLRLEAEMAGETNFSVSSDLLDRSPDIVASEMALLRARQLDFVSRRDGAQKVLDQATKETDLLENMLKKKVVALIEVTRARAKSWQMRKFVLMIL